jgi:hypothetical protein
MTKTIDDETSLPKPVPFVFDYRNHAGEISTRTALPLSVRWDSTKWHEAGWLMEARDLTRPGGAMRDFALPDINPADRATILTVVDDMKLTLAGGAPIDAEAIASWIYLLEKAVPRITRSEPAPAASQPE